MTGGSFSSARRALLAVATSAALVTGTLAISSGPPAAAVTLPDPVPSTGCGTSTRTATVEEELHLQIGTSDRWYLRTIPSGHDGVHPIPVDTSVSAEVLRRVYDCPADADLEFYVIIGGGHAWPGSAFSQQIVNAVGYTTMDIHASEVAWAFFQRFRLPCDAAVPCPQGTPPPTLPIPTGPPATQPVLLAPAQTTPMVTPRFTG